MKNGKLTRLSGLAVTVVLFGLAAATGCDEGGGEVGAGGSAGAGGTAGGNSEFCEDDGLGSGTLATPVGAAGEFTTVLLDCSLSASEVAFCAGADPEFDETVAGDERTITGNGIPNHDADLFPNMGNPNVITPQSISYTVVVNPVATDTATFVNIAGVALNGIKMEPQTAERYSDTQWSYEALTFGGRVDGDTNQFFGTSLGFDCNFAHVQPTGEYHYHGVPTGLMPESRELTLVGWAADGFPILGRYGYVTPGDASSELVEVIGSYQLKQGTREALDANDDPPPGEYDGTFVQDWEYVEGLGDLDACNGRQEQIEVDGVIYDYAYYLTYTYPFMPRCVWGTPGDGFVRGPGGPPV